MPVKQATSSATPSGGLPCNEEAEKYVLGAIVVDSAKFPVVAQILEEEDFFSASHRQIFAAMTALNQRDESIDRITLANELTSREQLTDIGLGYLVALDEGLPVNMLPASYANIVKEKSRLRQLLSATRTAYKSALQPDAISGEVVKSAQEALLKISDTLDTRGQLVGEYIEKFPGGLNVMLDAKKWAPGIKTGLTEFDEWTDGFHPAEIFLIGARPGVGKSSIGLNIAHNIANEGGFVVVFSLEMSKKVCVDRLICEDARVAFNRFRSGNIDQEERERLQLSASRISKLPIFIDDGSALTVTEIGMRLQALMRDRPVALCVIDYVQLLRLSKGQRGNNENETFTLIANDLQDLFKRTGVPGLLLSQLNRDAEKNAKDKRPNLSHCRGCLSNGTLIWKSDGTLVPINEIAANDEILAVDSNQKIVPASVSWSGPSGTRQTLTITTETGKAIRATDNHPFLTESGWVSARDLIPGTIIATAMRLPLADRVAAHDGGRDDRCRLLGYMAGDGSYQAYRTIKFTNKNAAVMADCMLLVTSLFPGVKANRQVISRNNRSWIEADFVVDDAAINGADRKGANGLRNWFRELGISGERDRTKRVPPYVFESGLTGAAHYIAGYFATDGCITKRKDAGRYGIRFDSVSRELCEGVVNLLLKLGIVSRIGKAARMTKPNHQPIYRLSLCEEPANLRRFIETVPVVGYKKPKLDAMASAISDKLRNPGVFGLPNIVSRYVSVTYPKKWRDQGKNMRRQTATLMGERFSDPMLSKWGTSDLLWETIDSIHVNDPEDVYDLTVPGYSTFIANNIVVHNSGAWEQIANCGALLFREELYKRDRDDLRGEVEFIVAKNRSGPTGTIRLIYIDYLMKFENPARLEST